MHLEGMEMVIQILARTSAAHPIPRFFIQKENTLLVRTRKSNVYGDQAPPKLGVPRRLTSILTNAGGASVIPYLTARGITTVALLVRAA